MIICIGVSNIITNTEELIQNGIAQLIAEAFAFLITRSLIKPSFKLTLQILSRHNLNNELWQVCGKCLFFLGQATPILIHSLCLNILNLFLLLPSGMT